MEHLCDLIHNDVFVWFLSARRPSLSLICTSLPSPPQTAAGEASDRGGEGTPTPRFPRGVRVVSYLYPLPGCKAKRRLRVPSPSNKDVAFPLYLYTVPLEPSAPPPPNASSNLAAPSPVGRGEEAASAGDEAAARLRRAQALAQKRVLPDAPDAQSAR